MAKKFMGFKPETMEKKILPALGYQGAMDQKSINAFLASSPSAAAKMGKYTMAARQMVEGRPVNAVLGGLFGGPKFGTPEYKALTQQTHQRALDQQRFDKTMREGNLNDRIAVAKEFGVNPTDVIRQQPDRSGGGGGSAAAQSASGGQVVPMPVIPGTTSGLSLIHI